jgi:hypothetical protein
MQSLFVNNPNEPVVYRIHACGSVAQSYMVADSDTDTIKCTDKIYEALAFIAESPRDDNRALFSPPFTNPDGSNTVRQQVVIFKLAATSMLDKMKGLQSKSFLIFTVVSLPRLHLKLILLLVTVNISETIFTTETSLFLWHPLWLSPQGRIGAWRWQLYEMHRMYVSFLLLERLLEAAVERGRIGAWRWQLYEMHRMYERLLEAAVESWKQTVLSQAWSGKIWRSYGFYRIWS